MFAEKERLCKKMSCCFRATRKQLGITQEEMAERLDIATRSYSDLEQEKTRLNCWRNWKRSCCGTISKGFQAPQMSIQQVVVNLPKHALDVFQELHPVFFTEKNVPKKYAGAA